LQNDAAVISNSLTAIGNGQLGALGQAIEGARKQAFDQIEQQLAENGLIEKSKDDPSVLVSRNHGLMYLRGGTVTDPQATLGTLARTCAAKNALGAHWRLPNGNELGTLFGPGNFFGATNMIDVPDHRLWGAISGPPAPGMILFSHTAPMYVSYTSTDHNFNAAAYKLEVQGSQFVSQYRFVNLMLQGTDADSIPLTSQVGNMPIGLVCVADAGQNTAGQAATNASAAPAEARTASASAPGESVPSAADQEAARVRAEKRRLAKLKREQEQQMQARAVQPPQAPPPPCQDCGVIASISPIRQQGQAGLVGTLGGAAAGGFAGNQFGKGKGKSAMTALGILGGAFAGRAIEQQATATTQYQVFVNMDTGGQRMVTLPSPNGLVAGVRVHVTGNSVQPY
jgi:outer membrane lipoprotein SlyB